MNNFNKLMYLYEKSLNVYEEEMFVYHYLYNDDTLDDIIKDGKLLPVDLLNDEEKKLSDEKYAKRNKKNDADQYRHEIYAKKYEKVLGGPYSNYGIYLTPCDLFFDESLQHRFKISISNLSEKTIIQYNKEVEMFTPERLKEITTNLTQKEIEKIYWKSKKHFMVLPQVIDFSGELMVDETMLEKNYK